jgi:hypothetical protein
MTKTLWIPTVRMVATAMGGSLALGAILGLPMGPQALLRMALALPLVLLGVGIICAPALCIGGGLLDRDFSLLSTVTAFGAGLQATGYALLGFVPVALFLASTGEDGPKGSLPVVGLISTAVLLGLARLWSALTMAPAARPRILLLFLGWSVVSLGIGGILMARILFAGGLS